jgi:hypothetical protein
MSLVTELRKLQKSELKMYYGNAFYSEVVEEAWATIKEDPTTLGVAFHIKEFAVSIVNDPERINSENPRKIITPYDLGLLQTVSRLQDEGLKVSFEVDYENDGCAIMSVYWTE